MPENEVLDRAPAQAEFVEWVETTMRAVAAQMLTRSVPTDLPTRQEAEAIAFINTQYEKLLSEPVKQIHLVNPVLDMQHQLPSVQLVWYWRFKWDQNITTHRVFVNSKTIR